MIKAVPFKKEHLHLIDLNENFAGDPDVIASYQDLSHCVIETAVKGDTVLAILTGHLVFPHRFEVHTLISKAATMWPIEFVKHINSRIEHYIQVLDLVRVQTSIRASKPLLVKWMKVLGFEREGLMRNFGPEGDDYYLYARLTDG